MLEEAILGDEVLVLSEREALIIRFVNRRNSSKTSGHATKKYRCKYFNACHERKSGQFKESELSQK